MVSKRGILYFGGIVAIGLNTIVVWPVLGRLLSAESFATLVGYLSAATLCAPIVTMGTHAYVARYVPSPVSTQRRGALAVASTANALLATAFVGVFIAFLNWPGHGTIIAAMILAQGISAVASAAIRGLDRSSLFFLHALLVQSAALGLVGLWFELGGSLNTALMGAACLVAVTSSGVHCLAAWPRKINSAWDQPDWFKVLSFSVPLLPHLLLGVFFLQGPRLWLAILDGPDSVAIFQFAALVGGGMVTVIQAMSSHLGTDVLRSTSNRTELLEDMFDRLCLLSVGLAIAVTSFCAVALTSWLPPSVDDQRVKIVIAALLAAPLAQSVGDRNASLLMLRGATTAVSAATITGGLILVAALGLFRLFVPPEMAAGLAVTSGLVARGVVSTLLANSDGAWNQRFRRKLLRGVFMIFLMIGVMLTT